MEPAVESGTVFVLSGGGNLGAVQVGMLKALLEAGVRPDAVVGTSIGALNAAFLAGHGDLAGVEALTRLWESVRRADVFPVSVRSVVRGVLGHQRHVFESQGLRNVLVHAELGFDRLEDAPIPLHVVATDLASGEAVVLDRGNVVQALLASSAIPGVFPAVEIAGRSLVDGGVVANTPIAQAEALAPATVYVLPTTPDQLEHLPANAVGMMQRAMALASRPNERRALADASARRTVHILPVPALAASLSIFDFSATRPLVNEAHRIAQSWLETQGLGTTPVRSVAAEPASHSGAGDLAGALA